MTLTDEHDDALTVTAESDDVLTLTAEPDNLLTSIAESHKDCIRYAHPAEAQTAHGIQQRVYFVSFKSAMCVVH